ncbi:MAG: GAF domain-containing protein, partial [Anaerolineae bacterium]|nr:GAF domain-containing protein [Anaerolineae bacterium]
MAAFNITVLVMALSGLTLILALGLFLLVFSLSPRRRLNLYFAWFMCMVVLWTTGALISHTMAVVGGETAVLIVPGLRLAHAGYTGASIACYLVAAVLGRSSGRLFAGISVAGIALTLLFLGVLLFGVTEPAYTIEAGRLVYSLPFAVGGLFLLFDGAAVLLLWFQRRRIRERSILIGLGIFIVGQSLSQLNPYLRSLALPVLLADVSAFVIALALMRQQVVTPLLGRTSQLETVRDVGLTITSRLRQDAVLSAFAGQATGLLNADGAAIFLLRPDGLELAAVHNIPQQFVGHRLALGAGVVGQVALDGHTVRLDDYGREWEGAADLPLARATFGSIVAAPLVYSEVVQGVLIVVQRRQGKIFTPEDARLLELLGPQAAVAIANSRLFEEQTDLTEQLASAKDQLETVLLSTQNPVVAVDRTMRLIFANPAALKLLEMLVDHADVLQV